MVDLSAFYGRNRIDAPDERAWDLHAVLIGMGEEQAARGPDDLRRTVAERLAVLTATLPALPAGRPVPVLSVDGAAVELATFVRPRVVELVVHGDDLVASTGGRPLAVPASAAAIAVETLVTLARQRHGDARVIRALTRQERADLQCLRVF